MPMPIQLKTEPDWIDGSVLRALTPLAEDPISVPSTPMVAQNIYNSSPKESDALFQSQGAPGTYIVHIHICRQNTHTYKK